MPHLFDRVQETTTTSGTGNITLGGAVAGFRTFSSVLSTSDTCYYVIYDIGASTWEVGIGTLIDSLTLERTTVTSSSDSDALVAFGSGTKNIWIDYTAEAINATVPVSRGGTGAVTASNALNNLMPPQSPGHEGEVLGTDGTNANWINVGKATFIFTQSVASATWNINHNLGTWPSVTVIDSANSMVNGDVVFNDGNNLTITFSNAFSGKAFLN